MMSKIPVGGVIWQTLHYLVGFERLGFDTYYVEAHGRVPSMLMRSSDDSGSLRAARFIDGTLRRHGLAGKWAFQALHDDGRCYGLSEAELARLYRDAAFVVNLHGGTQPRPEHAARGRLVYLETDPVQLQIELFEGRAETVEFLDQHAAFFTFAENYGQSSCLLPVSGRYQFQTTRQPVVLDFWDGIRDPTVPRLTTIANWHQPWRNVQYQGRVFGWSKDAEFRRVLSLPSRSHVALELALSNCDEADQELLEDHGWMVTSAMSFSMDADAYRRFIVTSAGEFSVAKEQNVAFRTGWFSDRSATYLAAGRPVVMQDTGFTACLPSGAGLLAFADEDEASAALEDIIGDYRRHADAASAIARSHFASDVVLGDLVNALGESLARTRARASADPGTTLPAELSLAATSKRPLVLNQATERWLDEVRARGSLPRGELPDGPPEVTIVIPVRDQLRLTQLCLASVLAERQGPRFELVVIDDASSDGTAGYLSALASVNPHLQVLTNSGPMGFAASVNRGVKAAGAPTIVLLNNDVVVTPGWLGSLVAHLDASAVGLVAACTTAHARNCHVREEYGTFGDLIEVATRRRRRDGGKARDVRVAPFFCVALRADVWDEVGDLDERFAVGMFEDDDYCLRLVGAGYQLVCALDTLVHHFGEGTLGALRADGRFSAIFEANRAAFEAKWGGTWTPVDDYPDPAYQWTVEAARALMDEHVPAAATVAIVSLGDDDLLNLSHGTGAHFPQLEGGEWAGGHPADGLEAVRLLDAARERGTGWLFVPAPAEWWFEHYPELTAYLSGTANLVAGSEPIGWLYRLHPAGPLESSVPEGEEGSPGEAAPPAAHLRDTGHVALRPGDVTSTAGPRPELAPAAGCTIIARNYLSQARTLVASYFAHHPDGRFYLLVVDALPDGASLDPRVRLVDVHDLPLDDLYEMFFKYDVVELSTAVKPALLTLLIDGFGEDRVMYIDPDILIMRPMTEVFAALEHSDIVLTPHLNAPIPFDGRKPTEQDILISGAYNLGFIALRGGDETSRFLAWWRERLVDLCRVDPAKGLMVDQRWIDLAPSLFPRTYVLRDDTYNVAYWNLHARTIGRDGVSYSCNGRPLAMFHFSGFNPGTPDVLSRHQTRTDLEPGTALHELYMHYRDLQVAAGCAEYRALEYGLSRFDNGFQLHPIFRRLYLEADEEQRRQFGDPFATAGDASFFAWATRAHRGRRGLSPFLEEAYRLRYDVQAAYPDVEGADRDGFLVWAAGQGAVEFGFEPELVGLCEPRSAGEVQRPVATPVPGPASAALSSEPGQLPGVNLCGYLHDESGVGEAARSYVAVLEHLGVPLSLRDVSELSVNRSQDTSIHRRDTSHEQPVNLVCVNADQHFVVARRDPGFFEGKYNIGVWWWELPSFPDEWRDRFEHYDEIWAGTSYIANALAPISPVPVVRVPPALSSHPRGDRSRGRAMLGLHEDEFTYLYMFDFHSYFERKNPMAVIAAFQGAFPTGDEDVRLVIKSVNGGADLEGSTLLERAASMDERITLLTEYVEGSTVSDLMEACDAYVSLHRAEGLGLSLAHAMAAAKPVIATGWSGNTDFMDTSNALLVRFELVAIERDVGPYKAGAVWAEPDVDHAGALMRYLFENPDEGHALGRAARTAIGSRFATEGVAEAVRARLAVIGARLRTSRVRPALLVPEHAGNQAVIGTIRQVVAHAVTDERPIIVISKGDPVLTDLGGRECWHFPQNGDGEFAGYYPPDSAIAIAHLESLRARGAGYLLVPASCKWWLTHYREFGDYVHARYHILAEDASCLIFGLEVVPSGGPSSIDLSAAVDDLRAQVQHLQQTLAATGEWVSDLAPRVSSAQEQLASLPRVLEEAFATVSATIGAVEGDVTARLDALEAVPRQVADGAAGALPPTAPADAEPDGTEPGVSLELVAPSSAGADLLRGTVERVTEIERRMSVRPYMSSDRFYTEDLDKPMGFCRADDREDSRRSTPTFADVFRGDREFIADRQRAYLQFVCESEMVIDLGCGRCEFLELLSSQGIPAEGIEQDEMLVRQGQARGLPVRHGDALAYLDQAVTSSVATIFSAQFIEHVRSKQLPHLVAQARRVLRPGGLFIAETVNPECPEALKTFHVDLTHHRPIFPQVLLEVCWEAGFDSAWVFYPLGGGFTQRNYDRSGEYAVVAQA
jgi:GT2 family glycosyltransferase/glycosyltransferase involved in cell wall biosynthesis/SAM-dependent methyltransferase